MLTLALIAHSARKPRSAQERPAAFVDAATVVPGTDRRDALRRFAQFCRPTDRRLRGAALPADASRRRRARRGGARPRAARPVTSKCSTATGRRGRWRISCAGRAISTTPPARRSSIPTSTSARCFATAISPRIRPFARLDRRPDAGAGRRPRARYGHAVRLLQPEIMDRPLQRQRRGHANRVLLATAMRAARLSPLRQGMVALHAVARTVSGHLFRFSECGEFPPLNIRAGANFTAPDKTS